MHTKVENIQEAYDKPWDRLFSNTEDDIHGCQMVAYKLMKNLNQEERETVNLHLIPNDKWIEHFRELCYDPNAPQEAVKDITGDTGVDSIIYEELEGALSSMKNRKGAGLDGISSKLLKYCSMLLTFRPVSYTHLDVYKRQPPYY